MWKFIISVLVEKLYSFLERNNLLSEEQKRCRKQIRATKDNSLIDKRDIENCRSRLTGLNVVWLDYKKSN